MHQKYIMFGTPGIIKLKFIQTRGEVRGYNEQRTLVSQRGSHDWGCELPKIEVLSFYVNSTDYPSFRKRSNNNISSAIRSALQNARLIGKIQRTQGTD